MVFLLRRVYNEVALVQSHLAAMDRHYKQVAAAREVVPSVECEPRELMLFE
jgi:hypothetical protein